jgi:hypothetical protein
MTLCRARAIHREAIAELHIRTLQNAGGGEHKGPATDGPSRRL